MIEKFPYKKQLHLEWYQAAIGYLLFFKTLKEKLNNNIYFLVSETGISLKANTPSILKQAEDEVTRFYNNARIDLLDMSYTSQFYEKVLIDIKDYTTKLQDSKDCPYINLVYSQKIRQSCQSLKGFKYNLPYQRWEEQERTRRGFAYLIVRPRHRWEEMAKAINNIATKRQATQIKSVAQNKMWVIELPFQKFIWIYLKKEFNEYKDMIEIKDSKNENLISIGVSHQLPYLSELQKQIQNLNFQMIETPPSNLKQLTQDSQIVTLTSLELERISQNLYHEFGMSSQLKRIKHLNKHSCLIVGPVDVQLWMSKKEEYFHRGLDPQLTKLQPSQVKLVEKLNRRHEIVQYDGYRYFSRRYDKPLKQNTLNQLKLNIPTTTRYYFYYEKDNAFFMLRHYYYKQFHSHFNAATPLDKLLLMESLAQALLYLHKNSTVAGTPFADCVYVQEDDVIIDCKDEGSVGNDFQEFKMYMELTLAVYKPVDRTEQLVITSIHQYLEESNLAKVADILLNFRCLLI